MRDEIWGSQREKERRKEKEEKEAAENGVSAGSGEWG
jgi:hypothetical protein